MRRLALSVAFLCAIDATPAWALIAPWGNSIGFIFGRA